MMIKKLVCLALVGGLAFNGIAMAAAGNDTEPTQHVAKASKKSDTIVVNINTADAKTLQQLPHIGPKLAERIVDYRQQHGAFQTVGDLSNVKGVSKKLLADLDKQLKVS